VPPVISSRVITIAPPGSYLGIGIQQITPERAKALKLREEAGVEVTQWLSIVRGESGPKRGRRSAAIQWHEG
jgi:hypothetical protein